MKLSETNLIKLLFNKNKDYINRYVFLKEESFDFNKHYDIALVLGCSNYDILYKRSDAAIDLYKRKIIDKLYLSGGKGYFTKNKEKPEALVMKEYMLSKGVKEEDIIIEIESKDTISNFKNSLELIKNNYKENISIVLVTSSFHIKRAKGYLENMCNHKIYPYPVKDGICDKDIWQNNKVSRKLIRTEARLLYSAVKKKKMKDMEI